MPAPSTHRSSFRAHGTALARVAHMLGTFGLMMVGAYPEPNARRVVGWRRQGFIPEAVTR